MKKIIALLLLCVCVFSFAACKDKKKEMTVDDLAAMYNASAPTKTIVNTTRTIKSEEDSGDGLVLNDTYTLVSGKIDGYNAAVYTHEYDELSEVTESGGEAIQRRNETREFYERDGYGLRVNGGDWNPSGTSIIPSAGSNAINFTSANVTDVKVDGTNLTFRIPSANVSAVFGNKLNINADSQGVTVEIETDGSLVTSVTIRYTSPAGDVLGECSVVIKTVYSYDLEMVTLLK